MTQDEDFSDELAIDLRLWRFQEWIRIAFCEQDDHTFADVFSFYSPQSKRSRLTSRSSRCADSFPFDRSYGRRCELPQSVRSDHDGIACVDDARFDDSRDNGSNEGH